MSLAVIDKPKKSETSLEFIKPNWEINVAWNSMLMLAVSEMTVAMILLPMGNYCAESAYAVNGLPLCYLMALEYGCLLLMILGSFGYCAVGTDRVKFHPKITYYALSAITILGSLFLTCLCLYFLYSAVYHWALFVFHHFLLIIGGLHRKYT